LGVWKWGNPLTREEEEAAAEAAAATPSKIERACELVRSMLAEGEADATTVKRTAEAMGISTASLHRAYRILRIESWPLQDDRTGLMKGMALALPGHRDERRPRRCRSSRQASLGFTGEHTPQPPKGRDHPAE
jgi:hypothetical protein